MKAISFDVKTEADLKMATKAMEVALLMGEPYQVEIKNLQTATERRKAAQSNLSFAWYKDAARQKVDMTAADIRAYCKLHIGVAIRQESEDFRQEYNAKIKNRYSYEEKLEMMLPPWELPITSKMSVKQMTTYLNEMDRIFSEHGIILPKSDDNYYLAMGVKRC